MKWMLTGTLANALLQLLFIAVLARHITPHEYGVAGIVLAMISFITVASQLGVSQSLIQRKDLNPRHIQAAHVFSSLLGSIFAVAVYASAPCIVGFFDLPELQEAVKMSSVVFLAKGVSLVSEAMISKAMRFKWMAIRNVIAYALGYGCIGIPMALMNFGYWSLIAAQIAQELIRSWILLIAYRPPKVNGFHLLELRQLLSYGAGQTLASMMNRVATQGDNIIIGKMLGSTSLGLYSQAYRLIAFPAVLVGEVISKVLFPAFASIQDRKEKLAEVQLRGVFLTSLAVLPLCALVFVNAQEILRAFLGPQWDGATPILRILSIGIYFRVGYKINGELAKAAGRVAAYAYTQAAYALSVVCFCVVGSLAYGVVGASWGVLLALAINFFTMQELGRRVTGTSLYQLCTVHSYGVLAALVGGGTLFALTGQDWYGLLVDAFKLSISFCVTFFISCFFVGIAAIGPHKNHFAYWKRSLARTGSQ